MTQEPRWRRYLRFRGPDASADLDDELRHHVEQRIEEYRRQGMTPEEAEAAARARLGDVEDVRRACGEIADHGRRRREGAERARLVASEVRHAARRLRRRPGFTGAAAATLALGVGAVTAIFAVVDGVLLRPLPFTDPGRLVDVYHTAPGLGFDEIWQADATYLTYRADNTVFEDLGLWNTDRSTVTGRGEPELVSTLVVSDGLLPVLDVPAVAGRRFLTEDDARDAPLTVMLGEGYWRTRFGGDPAVVGTSLEVNGRSREIIGVVGRGFVLLDYEPDILVPFQFDPARARVTNFSYHAIGRLKDGVTPERARAELDRLFEVAFERYPEGLPLDMARESGMAVRVLPLKDRAVGGVRQVLWTLFGTVGLVLLIAAANVAGLFMVRGEGRQREVAVRTALGAGRRRAAAGFLVESGILGLIGGAAGLALAAGGVRALVALAPAGIPRLREIAVGPAAWGFAFALSVLAALAFGALTARRYGRPDLNVALREGARGGGAGRARQRLRSALVVGQMALALVLLVGAGLMIRSLEAMGDVHPGFERPEEILTFGIGIPMAEEPDPILVAEMHERLLSAVSAVPGVRRAALVSRLPMEEGVAPEDLVDLQDFPTAPGAPPRIHRSKWVGGGYFDAMENPVVAGRPITWDDVRARADVVVITEDLAVRYWGDARSALGRRLRNEETTRWREIVGVVGSVHDDGPDRDPVPIVYWPQVQTDFWGNDTFTQRKMSYVLRVSGVRPTSIAAAVREAVWSVNPNLPLANVMTLDAWIARAVSRTSFTVVMLAIAAGVALVLGIVGLYGVVSYAVATRTREIGVRMALGARSREVVGMVVGHGAKLALVGLAIGVPAALLTMRVLTSLLYGVAAVDPATYAATALLLGGVALLASWLPARRAARIEPTEALRHE